LTSKIDHFSSTVVAVAAVPVPVAVDVAADAPAVVPVDAPVAGEGDVAVTGDEMGKKSVDGSGSSIATKIGHQFRNVFQP